MTEGYLVLEGGAEFGGQMAEPDRRAIELAGGPEAKICIIPTAAAPDHNHQRAGTNGVRWFSSLGAKHVDLVYLLDKQSANDAAVAEKIRLGRLIYMLGGFTGYLGETVVNSASHQAMRSAYEAGAVLAGSSAGAMVLCQYYYDPGKRQVVEGLNFLPNTCVLPHHNTFGKGWVKPLSMLLPSVVLVGIDERTGMIDDGPEGRRVSWHVYGQGNVTLYRAGQPTIYRSGQTFTDNFLSPPLG